MGFADLLGIAGDVLFQRLHLRRVPDIDSCCGDVRGMTAIVTGPTSGIGRETAAALARGGARVVLACRSLERGRKLMAALAAEAAAAGDPRPALEVRPLDLASLASVRSFAAAWEGAPLDILVCNAGVFTMVGARSESADGVEAHAAANHVGHFLLTLLLLPCLKTTGTQARPARIVHVSSAMHRTATGQGLAGDPQCRQHYTPTLAYSQSKLAQASEVIFAAELRRRLAAASPAGATPRVVVAAVHPGEVITNVVRSLPAAVQALYAQLMAAVLLTPREGARSSVFAATGGGAAAAVLGADGLAGPSAADPAKCYFGSGCVAEAPGADALDPPLGRWLWGWSAGVTGLPAKCDLPPAAGV